VPLTVRRQCLSASGLGSSSAWRLVSTGDRKNCWIDEFITHHALTEYGQWHPNHGRSMAPGRNEYRNEQADNANNHKEFNKGEGSVL